MFADAGSKPPPGMGTGRPEQVGAAVVKAVERNRAEVAVGPIQQRFLAHFSLAAPAVAVRAQSGSLGQRAAQEVADGHPTSKR
jgi:hypothetical protein